MEKRWSALAAVFAVIGLAICGALVWYVHPSSDPAFQLPLLIVGSFGGLLLTVALIVFGYKFADLANASEALALPAGSVRALIALLIIVMFAVMSFYFVQVFRGDAAAKPSAPQQTTTSGPQQKPAQEAQPPALDVTKQILTVLSTLMSAISAFYFGAKTSETALNKGAQAVADALIKSKG